MVKTPFFYSLAVIVVHMIIQDDALECYDCIGCDSPMDTNLVECKLSSTTEDPATTTAVNTTPDITTITSTTSDATTISTTVTISTTSSASTSPSTTTTETTTDMTTSPSTTTTETTTDITTSPSSITSTDTTTTETTTTITTSSTVTTTEADPVVPTVIIESTTTIATETPEPTPTTTAQLPEPTTTTTTEIPTTKTTEYPVPTVGIKESSFSASPNKRLRMNYYKASPHYQHELLSKDGYWCASYSEDGVMNRKCVKDSDILDPLSYCDNRTECKLCDSNKCNNSSGIASSFISILIAILVSKYLF